ncbi:hypothetical protein STAS_32381 [Striga asiatica]|uniref:Uncharacterized protein n=1 Tax=Striga asiatica TaxID=4170 RepID=A0A5A7RDU2_STRAF|nr:hypothetical protein STAS_32381 [Striga asiatica]
MMHLRTQILYKLGLLVDPACELFFLCFVSDVLVIFPSRDLLLDQLLLVISAKSRYTARGPRVAICTARGSAFRDTLVEAPILRDRKSIFSVFRDSRLSLSCPLVCCVWHCFIEVFPGCSHYCFHICLRYVTRGRLLLCVLLAAQITVACSRHL